MKKTILWICGILLFLGIAAPTLAQDTILELKERIIDIQNKGELGFRNFTLCSNILGYGQYVPLSENKVKVGSEIYFYYEPVNVYTNRRSGTYQIWFTQDMILLSEDGQELYNGPEALNFNYQTTSPVLDVFASNTLTLGDLPSGKYQFRAVLHDKLKRVEASYTYTFEIVE